MSTPWSLGGMSITAAAACLLAACGCGGDASHGREARSATAGPPAAAAEGPASPSLHAADSLVLGTPGGSQIWFTDAREAHAATGEKCLERVLEIRTSGDTVRVPLLYTGEVPELVDDTTLRAHTWRDCAATDPYLVDIRTGRPRRERP